MARRRISERYVLCDKLGEGGQASVHYGRILGASGFTRTVAIKRLNEAYAGDPESRGLFVDEARLASRIRHPNVVSLLDVVESFDELFLVMEYLPGLSLAMIQSLAKQIDESCPPEVAATIACDMLRGLHAAHEATNENGEPLRIIHRDVSPQNVMLGLDGVSRVVDFGIAKAIGRNTTTDIGILKGKRGYMAPEQLRAVPIDRRVDIFAVGIVLWELLVGKRLFTGTGEAIWLRIINEPTPSPAEHVAGIPSELGTVVVRALCKEPEGRFPTALAMAEAIEHAIRVATPTEIGVWVEHVAGAALRAGAERVAELERQPDDQVELDSQDSVATEFAVASQKTGISLTTKFARQRELLFAACGVAIAAFVAFVIAITRTGPVPAAVASDRATSPIASGELVANAPPPKAEAASSEDTKASASASAATAPPNDTRQPHPPRSGTRTAPARSPDCKNPFVVNDNGHKVFRSECIR